MPHHTRKRARVPANNFNDNESVITATSASSTQSAKTRHDALFEQLATAAKNFSIAFHNLYYDPVYGNFRHDTPSQPAFDSIRKVVDHTSTFVRVFKDNIHENHDLKSSIEYFINNIKFKNFVDTMVSTETIPPPPTPPKPSYTSIGSQADTPVPAPPPMPPKPTYACVATQANIPAPKPFAHPPSPDPRPSHVPRPDTAPHSHKLHGWPRPKAVNPTPSPRPSTSTPKAKTHIRLIARVANDAEAFTSPNPRWRTVPTDCFSTLAKEFKSLAPSCSPLGYYTNKKGNLVITFSGTTPRGVLMSQTRLIRGSFELSQHVPIIFDTPWSTLHLANVPARPSATTAVFDQAALTSSILDNPAISGLTITSQPRWLRHPSKIIGTRSSAVLSFEDPDGAIARQLLKTPFFVFGSPVTVKPWINKPTKVAPPPTESALASSSSMDVV